MLSGKTWGRMANEDSSVATPQVGPGSDEAGIDSGIGAAYVEPTPAREATTPQATAAALFVVLLLVLSTTSQGAFAVSRWAPLALLTVAVVIGSVAVRRGVTVRSAPAKAALAAIWAL